MELKEIKALKKEYLVNLVVEQQETIEKLKQLKDENDRLRKYVEMANSESQTLTLELKRTQRLLRESYEAQHTLLQSLDALLKTSTKNLQYASIEAYAQKKEENN